ncbi:large ribosomal RNA subunit accumulation protein YCED homolog 1, chloroplastic [Salvia miltiorrhiza]|uniref:large ribosomal RNA subunit accumulation protein YCED homolog 1, chloroplastic n=1 Tax=Salvia miltiorrhiza TaxID=226208 RepID=UPI0025AC2CD8|nr:large ribosomal RNA subunit accumulation protein YCED homolog 1, chloroplastic [Salvia miltiorrhiza]
MLRPIASPLPSPPPIKFSSHHRPTPHKPFIPNHPANTTLNQRFTPSITKFCSLSAQFDDFSGSDWELGDEEIEIPGDDDEGCPWEGAILYRRNGAISHLEYATTLESLGLAKVSSGLSRTRAFEMGLRLVKPVTDYPDGTPVLISVDVTRRKHKLRLDGIVRTVIALNCNRCGEPAAQSVYSNFALLLCEEPIAEPETINIGMIFGEEKLKTFETEEDDDASIDLDDQLYFPPEQKVIDISKNIRDIIHVEITISAVCDPNCKGLCLKCGANLNISKCTCRQQKVEEKAHGPLGNLRKQMQQT